MCIMGIASDTTREMSSSAKNHSPPMLAEDSTVAPNNRPAPNAPKASSPAAPSSAKMTESTAAKEEPSTNGNGAATSAAVDLKPKTEALDIKADPSVSLESSTGGSRVADLSSEDIDVITPSSADEGGNSAHKELLRQKAASQGSSSVATAVANPPSSSSSGLGASASSASSPSQSSSSKTEGEEEFDDSAEDDRANLPQRLKRIRTHVVSALIKHPKSSAFREPVNAKALGIFPIYHQIIKKPMDLGTVRRKIDKGQYPSRAAVLRDINQIWTNAKTFNQPGHFVHEAAVIMAKLTRDKWDKLERDEKAGVYANSVKTPSVSTPKPKPVTPAPAAFATPISAGGHGSLAGLGNESAVRKRMARKISTDLPGESPQPQQLKKKYVESLSGQMRSCDNILKQLMSANSPHKSYVEPFLHITNNSKAHTLDLYKVQSRLQSGHYRHPLHFANDVRRIVTETYRGQAGNPRLVEMAGNMQHAFEVLFCRVDFEPVPNMAYFDEYAMEKATAAGVAGPVAEEEQTLQKLLHVQQSVNVIRANISRLVTDLPAVRARERGSRPGAGGRKRPRAPRKRAPAANKRAKANPVQNSQPAAAAAAAPAPVSHSLTVEESLSLREQVAMLKEDQQQRIVDIMVKNRETLTTDANGFTEIDLSNCSEVTVRQIQAFIMGVKAEEERVQQQAQLQKQQQQAASKAKKGGKGRKSGSPVKSKKSLSDSSSDDSDSDDSDSSSSSSGSDSDD